MTELERLVLNVKRLIRLTIGIFVVLALVIAGGVVVYMSQRHQLCRQIGSIASIDRDKAIGEIAQSQQYLKDHPHGTPSIPASLIRNSIAASQNTLARLDALPCRT